MTKALQNMKMAKSQVYVYLPTMYPIAAIVFPMEMHHGEVEDTYAIISLKK